MGCGIEAANANRSYLHPGRPLLSYLCSPAVAAAAPGQRYPRYRMQLARSFILLIGTLATAVALAQDVPLFKLVAKGGRFEPAVLEVPAGARFRVEIDNQNTKAIEFESKDLKQEKVIPPGTKG